MPKLKDRHYAKAVLANFWLQQIDLRAPKQLQAFKLEDGRWSLKGQILIPGREDRTWDEIDDDIDGPRTVWHQLQGADLVFGDVFEAMEGKDRMIRLLQRLEEYQFPSEVLLSMAHQPDW